MKNKMILTASIFVLMMLFTACNAAVQTPATSSPEESTVPAFPTEDVLPTSAPSIPLTTYEDTASGFTFDYPADWMLDSIILGERAPTGYQITSWAHDPGMVAEVPEGGTIINIAVQQWDPRGDLTAFIENRKLAWEASGITIMKEENLTLGNGLPAVIFVVIGADDVQGYFLMSTLGENYLVVSGSGDQAMIDLVARSVR